MDGLGQVTVTDDTIVVIFMRVRPEQIHET